MRRSLVDESVIDLVANHHQVACDGDLGERVARWLVEGGPRWIRRIAEEEGLRADRRRVNGLSVETPVIACTRCHWDNGTARKDDSGEVGHIRRLWQHDAVARADGAANGEVNRL